MNTSYYEDDALCSSCHRNLNESTTEWCPDCCPNDGYYEPGTEQCDWCNYSEECSELWDMFLKEG